MAKIKNIEAKLSIKKLSILIKERVYANSPWGSEIPSHNINWTGMGIFKIISLTEVGISHDGSLIKTTCSKVEDSLWTKRDEEVY